MRTINWRDEKLYRITARDYGSLIHRSWGVIVNSIAKGTAIAVVVVFIFLTPRLLTALGKDWYKLFLPFLLVCSIGSGFSDRSSYVCEIEIRPDRLVRHLDGKTSAIERTQVRQIREGGHWTVFGWVHGLVVQGKGASIFVPAGCPEYPEIKSRLNAWHSAAS